MPIRYESEGQDLMVQVSGEVDHHAARTMMTDLLQKVDTYLPPRLVMDLGGVSFMDSSGIALILRTWQRLRASGGHMELRNIPPQAEKVLRAAGVQNYISFGREGDIE